MIRAEVIAIGDELTSGQRLDTNSQWLSLQLADLGIRTAFHTTVGDCLDDHVEALRGAAGRSSIVVCSGGLGPTADDLTREAMAMAFAAPLESYPEAMAHIEAIFAKRKRPMPDRNRAQAMFPRGSRIIPNPHGTAPGIDLWLPNGVRLFALPGVPAEMKEMWQATVMPRLIEEQQLGRQRWFYRSLKVFGIGESDVEARLPELIARDRVPQVGITVSKATITLRIACLASDVEMAAAAARSTEEEIHQALGSLVFGEGDDELHDVVHRQLMRDQQSLAVIEIGGDSLIGGWLSRQTQPTEGAKAGGIVEAHWYPTLGAMITQFAGGGIAPPSPAAGSELGATLSEPQPLASDRYGEEFCRALALARQRSTADWILLIGPYPPHATVADSTQFPTVACWIGLCGRDGQPQAERLEISGHPEILFARIAKTGLDYFRRQHR